MKAHRSRSLCIVVAVLALASVVLPFGASHANTVDVSYTVSGSPGDWTYDFSITNNIGGTNDIYALEITPSSSSSETIIGSPSGWGIGTFTPIEWCFSSNCGFTGATNLAPGQTLSGFLVQDTSLTPITSADWLVAAEGGTYTGPDNTNPNNPSNPTFIGTASTPLPAALPLFATGLGGLGLLGWRRKRKAQVA
jgi:hypothetical protein